jgi:TIR domain
MYEYIFLSTSHSDNEAINKLLEKLEAAGHKVWLSQAAADTVQQQRQTEFAIERSEAFILVLDPETVAVAESFRGLALAQEAGKPIFLVQISPVSLPADLETSLDGRPLVDLSSDFEAGFAELLSLLAGPEARMDMDVGEPMGDFFGGEHFGRVVALPGEQIVWSESGLYWYKKWKTLVRVLVTMTGQRLIFFWDERDIWKWKPREADELEKTFPIIQPLDEISNVGELHRPKAFLIFATGKPYVEIQATGGQLHRFSLQKDFETNISSLRDAVKG